MEVLQATRGFNTKMAYISLDDLGYPYFRNIYIYAVYEYKGTYPKTSIFIRKVMINKRI
jgi:hypothetical protein